MSAELPRRKFEGGNERSRPPGKKIFEERSDPVRQRQFEQLQQLGTAGRLSEQAVNHFSQLVECFDSERWQRSLAHHLDFPIDMESHESLVAMAQRERDVHLEEIAGQE